MPTPAEIEEQEIKENHFLEDLTFVKEQVRKWFVNNIVQRALSHLVGWTGTKAIMLRCTSDGRLRVTTEVIGKETGSYAQVAVGDTATLLKAANEDRVSIAIQCISTNDVYIGLSNAVTSSNGFLLSKGQVFSVDVYLGAIWGIEDGDAGKIAYMEF